MKRNEIIRNINKLDDIWKVFIILVLFLSVWSFTKGQFLEAAIRDCVVAILAFARAAREEKNKEEIDIDKEATNEAKAKIDLATVASMQN